MTSDSVACETHFAGNQVKNLDMDTLLFIFPFHIEMDAGIKIAASATSTYNNYLQAFSSINNHSFRGIYLLPAFYIHIANCKYISSLLLANLQSKQKYE